MSAVLLTQWARLLMHTLWASGVRDVVVSPGSRSTPFTWAALRQPGFVCHSALDERTAAFFALGQAKLTGRPSLLIATSGSALGHYFPALVEASYSYTPLLALTADRPVELLHRAAPQTIDQAGVFGRSVRGSFDLGAPASAFLQLLGLQASVAQAVRLALHPLPGPVHLNAPARKPLAPAPATTSEDLALEAEVTALIERGPTRFSTEAARLEPVDLNGVSADLEHAERGLIVCGALPAWQTSAATQLARLSKATGFPLIAEVPSQLVLCNTVADVCPAVDSVLQATGLSGAEPDFVLHFGPPLTSQAWATLEAGLVNARRHVVARHGWPDVTGSASYMHASDAAAFAELLSELCEASPEPAAPRRAARLLWAERFAAAQRRVALLQHEVLSALPFGEAHAARLVCAALPADSLLFLGNSLPLRAVDAFARPSARGVVTLVQRGANGIDGLVSGVAGIATAGTRATTLLLGDVSFAHDVGGLMLARGVTQPLVIVVVDNAGGRIFDELPMGAAASASEEELRFWRTPPGLDLEAIARGYGVRYRAAESALELSQALEEAYQVHAATLLHVRVPGDGYRSAVRRLSARIRAALAHPAEPGSV
jgi:2-succinyl-5-enolpyruvyl-6-hydroxy-3-cyclohexene-1-carboxylate synthase